jgi:hypothetical protein
VTENKKVFDIDNQASEASDPDLLDCPIWILVINIVAMEMLRAKLPPAPARLTTGKIAWPKAALAPNFRGGGGRRGTSLSNFYVADLKRFSDISYECW